MNARMSVVEANLIITKTLFTIVYDSMEKQKRIFSSFYRFFRASNVNSQEDMSFFMGVEARHGKIFTTHLQAINLYVILEQKNCFIRK